MSTNRPRKSQQKDGNTQGKSQPGRRKLDFEHKPLHGKIFYFDLTKYKNSAKLQKDIISLGGKVEEFLSNTINYVITNRPEGRELEKRSAAGTTSAESPSVSTPSPFQQGKGSSKDAADSPCALVTEKNNSSRGKAIASRALSSQQFGTVSVLSQAIQWGVQVKHLDSVLKYIKREQEKLDASPAANQQKSKACTERVSSSSRGAQSGVFIKIEDQNSQYRPISKSLEVWPRVSTDTPAGSCPYDGAAFKSKAQRLDQSDNAGPSNTTPVNKTIKKDKGLTLMEIRKRKAEKIKEKKKGFCECCKQRYDNLDKHLNCSEHREFVSNQNNYSALDRMITEGPDIASFLEDVIRYHEAQKLDALRMHQEFDAGAEATTKLTKASPLVARTKDTDTTNPNDLPGHSHTGSLQRENSLRVSLPLEHAQPKQFASQRSPEVINEAELDSSRVEEVYQEIWLGEPLLRSASEVDVNEFIKHRTAMQKKIANTSKKKVRTTTNPQKKQTISVEKSNTQEHCGVKSPNNRIPNRKSTQNSQESKRDKSPLVSPLTIKRKSVKRSLNEKDNDCNNEGIQEYEIKENPRKRRKTVTDEEYDDPVFCDDIPKESNKTVTTQSQQGMNLESPISNKPVTTSKQKQTKATETYSSTNNVKMEVTSPNSKPVTPGKRRQKKTIEVSIPQKRKSQQELTSPITSKKQAKAVESCIPMEIEPEKEPTSEIGKSPSKTNRGRACKQANTACGSTSNSPKNTNTKTISTKKNQNRKKDPKGLLNRVLGKNQRGKHKNGCEKLNRTFDATLSVEHVFSSDLGGSEFLGFQSEDIRESQLNLQLRINESMGIKAPLADAALEVTCVKCDKNDNASDSQTSSQDLAIECVLHTVDNFSQDESDWEHQIDGYMSKLDNIVIPKKESDKKDVKVEEIKPALGTKSSPIVIPSSPIKSTLNEVSHAFISEILERRQPGYQRTPVEDLFSNVRVRRRDVLFDSSAEDIENLPVGNAIKSEQPVLRQSKGKSPVKKDNKISKKCPPSPLKPVKKLRSQSLVEPRQAVSPVSPGLSVRNENIVHGDIDSPTKHLPPGSKLRERSKSSEPRTPRTPCKTQRCIFSTPEQKDKIWLVKSPGGSASPPMLQLPPGTPQEEVELIEENYVHDETEIEIVFPKFSSPMRIGSIKTPVKHIADPHTGRPVPSPVKSKQSPETELSSVISLNKALSLSPIKMNVAVYVPDFAKEGFARNLFGNKKSNSSKRSPPATSNAVVSPTKPLMLFYDKHSSTPTSATFRARTKVISPIFSAYKKPRFSLNLLKPPKMKYTRSGRRTRSQIKEEQEEMMRRLSLSQFINKSNTELTSDELNESLDAIYDFEEDVNQMSSSSSNSKKKIVKKSAQSDGKKSTQSESKQKIAKKTKKAVKSPQTRRRTRSSLCSQEEVSSLMMEELCSEGFFC